MKEKPTYQDLEDQIIELKHEIKLRDEMINTIPDPLYVKNKDFKYTICNNAFADYLGLPKSEIINSTVYDVSPKELADQYHDADCELGNHLGKQINESKVEYNDGTLHDIIFTKACLVDENNEFTGIVGIMLDVTKRKQAEVALIKAKEQAEESELAFRKIFEDSFDAILLLDQTGVFVECNQAALNLLKMTREQFLFQPPVNISPEYQPNGRKSEEEATDMINLAHKKGLHRFDWTHVNAEGGEFIVEISLMPIQVKGQTMLHTTWRNITERIRAEEEIRLAKEKAEKNEEKFKLLNRLTSEMLLLQDIESIIKFIAENLIKLYPNTFILYSSIDESIQQTKLEVISGIDNSLLSKVIKISGYNPIGKTFKLTEFHNKYFKSGNFIEFDGGLAEFSASEFPAVAAKAIEKLMGIHKIYTIGVNKDDGLLAAIHFLTFNKQVITDGPFIEVFINQSGLILQKKIDEKALKLAKENAESANIHKNYFLANMSHEIRTPMNGVLGFTNLLLEDDFSAEDRNRYLHIIERNSQQLLTLIDDIIDIAKIESNELKISVADCKILDVFKDLEENFNQIKLKLNKEKVGLKLEIPSKYKDLVIKTDGNRLRQVISNLLNNAFKFSEKGTITFGFKVKKSFIEFYVSDQGIGIPPEKLAEIFERFKQLNYKNAAKYGGTGLGLAISRGIISMLGGTITVKSEPKNGSDFSFKLPINKSEKGETY